MTSAPYALGVFRRLAVAPGQGEDGDGEEFTGLVIGDRVRDVSGLGTMNELLARWDDAQCRLDELAKSQSSGDWTDLARLGVRCPVDPGQILQCGANYRRHVVDIVMAERRADESMTGHNSKVPEAEVRAWAESMMDERARSGAPYVFAGLSGALTGLGTQRNRCVSKHGVRKPAQPAQPAQPAGPAHAARPALPAKQARPVQQARGRSQPAIPQEASR